MEGRPAATLWADCSWSDVGHGRDPSQSVFPLAARPLKAAEQRPWVSSPYSCLPSRTGTARPRSHDGSPGSHCSSEASLSLPARVLGARRPQVWTSVAALHILQGHMLAEHLLCARPSVHLGAKGSCVVPDLAGLIAQLILVPPCLELLAWSVLCSSRGSGVQ